MPKERSEALAEQLIAEASVVLVEGQERLLK